MLCTHFNTWRSKHTTSMCAHHSAFRVNMPVPSETKNNMRPTARSHLTKIRFVARRENYQSEKRVGLAAQISKCISLWLFAPVTRLFICGWWEQDNAIFVSCDCHRILDSQSMVILFNQLNCRFVFFNYYPVLSKEYIIAYSFLIQINEIKLFYLK